METNTKVHKDKDLGELSKTQIMARFIECHMKGGKCFMTLLINGEKTVVLTV